MASFGQVENLEVHTEWHGSLHMGKYQMTYAFATNVTTLDVLILPIFFSVH